MKRELKRSEFEDLSAWYDGELAGQRKGRVENLVATDALWGREYERLSRLDGLLDCCTIPADRRAATGPVDADLAERIIRNVRGAVRPRPLLVRMLAAGGAGLAAAAAILVVVLLAEPAGPPEHKPAAVVASRLKDVAAEDRFIVENLEFFENLHVLSNYESLEAIDRLESQPRGT